MRKNDPRRPSAGLLALPLALMLVLAGFLVASPAQADDQVDAGTNVAVVSNDCGEVTFTGANSDSAIMVSIGGEFGESFEVRYEESATISTSVNPLTYVAVTQWDNGGNWIEESSIEVAPCKDEAQEVEAPSVAPDAGR